MAKKRPKCVLCGRNLKGNEWQWLVDENGVEHQEKICRNERACKNRQRRQQEIYEVPQEARELEENGVQGDYKPSESVKAEPISNCVRRYLEVVVAVLAFIAIVVVLCMMTEGRLL